MSAQAPAQIVQFHLGRQTHELHREQLHAVPDGFTYREPRSGEGAPPGDRAQSSSVRTPSRLRQAAEWATVRALASGGFVRRARLAPLPEAALVHSAQLLLRDCRTPYVVDFEQVEVFTLYQRAALQRPWGRGRLLRALREPELRRLLPWSEAARRSLWSALGPAAERELAARTVTVLPAIRPAAQRPREREGGALRAAFVGTRFLGKGGVEAVRAVARARETHEVTLDLVSDVPERWRAEVQRAPGVRLHEWPTPHTQVRELLARSDVLLFPSHVDSLGFVCMEAMALGVPVLAARHFAIPEIVEHDVSGRLFDGESLLYGDDGLSNFAYTLPFPRSFTSALGSPSTAYVDRIAHELASLAEDSDLNDRLAHGALARVRDGPLSLERRREQLAGIYREALSS